VTAAALQRAAEARERVEALGVTALGQLHLPTAEAVEEVAAKVRAVATRAERIEGVLAELVERLERIEAKLDGRASAPGVDVTPPADVMPIRRD
jgi:hypothetical protein